MKVQQGATSTNGSGTLYQVYLKGAPAPSSNPLISQEELPGILLPQTIRISPPYTA